MSATKMTGGATAGTTSTTSTKKALWWIVIAIVGIIALIWVKFQLKGKGPEIVRFVTESPTDIVEGPPGVFHLRGIKPQKVEASTTGSATGMQSLSPNIGNIYPVGVTIKLTKEWQGVECFDNTKIISADFTSVNTFIQHRADMRDETIQDIPPSNWTIKTNINLTPGNIAEWRIRSDQTGTATVTTRLKDKPKKN